MNKTKRFGLWMTSSEKYMVAQLAELEGGLSQAAVIRRLIREAAQKYGVWSVHHPSRRNGLDRSEVKDD